jgi:hypothetical protein
MLTEGAIMKSRTCIVGLCALAILAIGGEAGNCLSRGAGNGAVRESRGGENGALLERDLYQSQDGWGI